MSKKKVAASRLYVWCGPKIPRVCGKYEMFDVIPAGLAGLAERHPVLSGLIVPIYEFSTARAELETGVGPYSVMYAAARKIIEGGNYFAL